MSTNVRINDNLEINKCIDTIIHIVKFCLFIAIFITSLSILN